MRGIKVFAPATVANVACGFDVLGLAIDAPGDEIIIRTSDTPGVQITKITGDQGKLSIDPEKNTAGVAALQTLHALGNSNLGVEMEIHKKMPFGSGMGSSAASAAAGAMAVNEIFKRPFEKRALLPFAVAGEQVADGAYHADNVAPSLLGGIILIRDNESLDIHRLPVPEGMYAVVLHPQIEILTKDARNILSETVTLKQAIAQTGNIAAFVTGLYKSDFDLISRSLNDAMIEPQRSKLIPHFNEVKNAALLQGALGCSISGAGPSIFALAQNSHVAEGIGKAMQQVFEKNKIESTLYISAINLEGAKLY